MQAPQDFSNLSGDFRNSEPVTLAERTMKGQTHENNHEFIYSALAVVILAIRQNEAAYFFRNFALGFSENNDGAMFPLKTEIWISILRTIY
jgi:hypothetical protein